MCFGNLDESISSILEFRWCAVFQKVSISDCHIIQSSHLVYHLEYSGTLIQSSTRLVSVQRQNLHCKTPKYDLFQVMKLHFHLLLQCLDPFIIGVLQFLSCSKKPGLGDEAERADLTNERAASKDWPSHDIRQPMTTAGARDTPALQWTNTAPF